MVKICSKDFDIKKIAESGQIFRMNPCADGSYFLVAEDKTLRIFGNELCCSQSEFDSFWKGYFDLEADYEAFRNAVPKSDTFLRDASDFGRGIRILRQDPWEMLVSFIISQRKSIPSIKVCIESLAAHYGEEIGEGVFAFPKAGALASASLEDLHSCALGYRDSYVLGAARAVYEGKIDLEGLRGLCYEDLLGKLMELRGVGAKVANCVALFAYHKIEAFPVDTWIEKVLRERYAAGFPFERYQGFAGVMQQYMFYFARSGGAGSE